MSTTQESSPLLDRIPRELRDQIYTSVFQDEHFALQNLQLPPLTQVCRQLRKESLPIFFKEATFDIYLTSDLEVRSGHFEHLIRSDPITKQRVVDVLENEDILETPVQVHLMNAGQLHLTPPTTELLEGIGSALQMRHVRFVVVDETALIWLRYAEEVYKFDGEDKQWRALVKKAPEKLYERTVILAFAIDVVGADAVGTVKPGPLYAGTKQHNMVRRILEGKDVFSQEDVESLKVDVGRMVNAVIGTWERFRGFDLIDLADIATAFVESAYTPIGGSGYEPQDDAMEEGDDMEEGDAMEVDDEDHEANNGYEADDGYED